MASKAPDLPKRPLPSPEPLRHAVHELGSPPRHHFAQPKPIPVQSAQLHSSADAYRSFQTPPPQQMHMVSHVPMSSGISSGASPQRLSPVPQPTSVSVPKVSLPSASSPGITLPHHIEMPPRPTMMPTQQMDSQLNPQVTSPQDMSRLLQPPIDVPTHHTPDVKYPLAYTSPNSTAFSPNIHPFSGSASASSVPMTEATPSISSTHSAERGDPAASSEEEDDMTNELGELHLTSHDLPDMSYVNRVPPALDPPRSVPFSTPITTGALFGEKLVVASQDKIRVLVVRRGAQFHTEAPEQSTEVIVPQTAEHYAWLDSPSNLSCCPHW